MCAKNGTRNQTLDAATGRRPHALCHIHTNTLSGNDTDHPFFLTCCSGPHNLLVRLAFCQAATLGQKHGEFAKEIGVRAEEAGDLRVDEVDGAVHILVPGQMLQNIITGRGGSYRPSTVRNSL